MMERARELTMPVWYTVGIVILMLVGLGMFNLLYINVAVSRQDRVERESDRRWCQLLTTLDDAYRAAPPQSETGRRLATDIHKLRQDLGCG